jgi:hypothetical protein
MNFSDQDIKQIEAKGLNLKTVEDQIELFKTGIPFTRIVQAATVNAGIKSLNESSIEEWVRYFESRKKELELVKFVPASGAATRMFKFLFKFLKEFKPEQESVNSYINKNKLKALALFNVGLEKFPFYNIVLHKLNEGGLDFNNLSNTQKALVFRKNHAGR